MIIYLHGFNSAGYTGKLIDLRTDLAAYGVDLETPTYPAYDPDKAIPKLEALIEDCLSVEELVIMGTSVGGFYARYLADKYNLKCILINPATEPQKTLRKYIGKNLNYITNEEYELTEYHLNAFAKYDLKGTTNENGMLVLLNEGDKIIDINIAALEFFDNANVAIYPGGGHRFEHSHESNVEIVKFYNTLWG